MFFPKWRDSEGQDQFFLTLSGYEFTNKVEVKAWEDDPEFAHRIEPGQMARISLLRRIHSMDVMHIEGFDKAAKRHLETLSSLDSVDITLEQAKDLYMAVMLCVPR